MIKTYLYSVVKIPYSRTPKFTMQYFIDIQIEQFFDGLTEVWQTVKCKGGRYKLLGQRDVRKKIQLRRLSTYIIQRDK